MAVNLTLKKSLFTPKFFPYLLDYSRRWEFWCGSAGSGKSYFLTQRIIVRCCSERIRFVVCRRYGTTLRNSVFALFKEVLEKWKLTQFVKIKETDMSITFPNGSQIILIGLDEETKLLSLANISGVWVEEAFEVPKSLIEQLNLRMRGQASNQQIWLSWNPISKNHWLYDFTVTAPPQNSVFIHSTYKDNLFLNREYIEALEELYIRNPQKAKVFCDGEWGVDADGLVLTNWKVQEFDNAEIDGQLMVGMDFGFVNDLSTVVASLLVEDEGRIYIFKTWGATGKTNAQLTEVITNLGFSKSVIVADCSEPKSIAEIKAGGIGKIRACKKGPDSIMHGIQKLQNYELIIHPSCEGLITELENYTWQKDKNTDNFINKPIDDFNHYIDALRYSLQCVGTRLKSFDKNLF